MNSKLKILEDKLIDEINNNPLREDLFQLENQIINNEECKILIDNFQKAQEDYNFYIKSFGEKHQFTINSQKKLYEAKLKMDENELIKKYNDILIQINEPLRYIEYKLISLFSRKKGHSC